jgi:hypothetical protein
MFEKDIEFLKEKGKKFYLNAIDLFENGAFLLNEDKFFENSNKRDIIKF